jgi:poly(3-hydroxybutyrate) depolymerase
VDELLGTPPTRFEPVSSFGIRADSTDLQVLTVNWLDEGRDAAEEGRGILVVARFHGQRSGLDRKGFLYLPAAYFTDASARYPAIEFFHGTPGGPRKYVNQLHVEAVLDGEISAGRIPPVIGVFPTMYTGHPGECTDPPRGPRDETYLAVDVPADAEASLRVLPGRSFAAVGYSTGGFCAANLGLHHPDRYVAAGSLAGYFVAGTDPTVGHPYRGSRLAVKQNSPLWEVTNRRPTAPPMIVVAARGDRDSERDQASFVSAVRHHDPRLTLYAALMPGAHNFGTWQAALPATHRLGGALPPARPRAAPHAASGAMTATSAGTGGICGGRSRGPQTSAATRPHTPARPTAVAGLT